MMMSTIEPLTTPAARLLALTRRWLTQSGELRARADRLGNCTAGRDAFIDACMLAKCAQDVHDALSADPAEEIREAPAKRASLTGEELAARIQAAGINAAPGAGGSVVLYASDIEAARILQFLEAQQPDLSCAPGENSGRPEYDGRPRAWHTGPDWTGWARPDEVRDALAALPDHPFAMHWAPYTEFGIPDPALETIQPPAVPVLVRATSYRREQGTEQVVIYWLEGPS